MAKGARAQSASGDERTAADYIGALDQVIGIVEMVVDHMPPTHPAVLTAKKMVRVVRPVIKKLDVAFPAVAPVVVPVMEHFADGAAKVAPGAVKQGARAVGGALDEAGKAVGDAADAVVGRFKAASDQRAQEKARQAARKALLNGAGNRIPADEFVKSWGIQQDLGTGGPAYLDFCGCYAIAAYDKPVKKDDFDRFRDIYIGRGEHMGERIHGDLTGHGNIDIYADMKYRQPLYIFLYPSTPEKLDELESSLITALDADASYNGAHDA